MADTGLIAFLVLIAAPAATSGLSFFLPLVAAFVGAIIGAWANSWYRDREAKKAEDRERNGLLTLVSAEYRNNDLTLRLLMNSSSLLEMGILTNLQTAVWDDTKVRLALLLPTDHVTALVLYYDYIQSIIDHIKDDKTAPVMKRSIVSAKAKQAIKYGEAAFSGKYLFADQDERPPERPEEPDG